MSTPTDLLQQALEHIHAARGLFVLQLGEQNYQLPVSGYDRWQSLPGMQQMEIAALPPERWPCAPPDNTDYFRLRGEQGSQWSRLRMASSMSLHVLTGSLLYCQDEAQTYLPLLAQQTYTLPAGRPYGLLGREDFTAQVSFTPRVTQPL